LITCPHFVRQVSSTIANIVSREKGGLVINVLPPLANMTHKVSA